MLRKACRFACCVTIFAFLSGGYVESGGAPRGTAEGSAHSGSLIPAPGYRVVQRECTVCHSEKLITQNRASRDGWSETIRWMQNTQNLRKFSTEEETTILDYLATHYAPASLGRRPPLEIRHWYELEP